MEKPVITKEERKVKRDARREKQRENNVFRALKMHKLRIEDQTPDTIIPHPPDTGPRYHIGCSGWFYWHWRAIFYPDDLPTSGWFEHYAERFKTVEINASFYSWPTLATVKSWVKQAGRKRFLYTVKVNELITHTKTFVDTEDLVSDFSYIAKVLGPRMGCFLFQLPPRYHYTEARLQTIVAQLRNGQRNVVEFRHASWWNDDVYKALREAGIIFCSCSAPRLPDKLIQTTDDLYIRFHGKTAWYRHDYTKDELQVWADRIEASSGRNVWIYFNNDFGGNAIRNARVLARRLGTKTA